MSYFSINKHACISLNMKIDHIMGHGIDLAFYEPNCEHNVGLSVSMAMNEMYKNMHSNTDVEM